MPQENSKRPASASPEGDPKRDTKRLRRATDLWSEDEHLKQDETVKQRLLGKGRTPREYFVNHEPSMGYILKYVADVAAQGPHSHLLHDPAEQRYYVEVLEDDPDLLKLVGEAYTSGSYKDVRCLGTSFCSTSIPAVHIVWALRTSPKNSRLRDVSSSHSVNLWSREGCDDLQNLTPSLSSL
jgi:hypothetical protein